VHRSTNLCRSAMNTRVTVPLSPKEYEAVSVLSQLAGVSRGRFLADILSVITPSLTMQAAAYRAAMELEGREREAFLDGINKAETVLRDALAPLNLDLDEMEVPDREATDARARTRADGSQADSDPPVTNRGVRSPRKRAS